MQQRDREILEHMIQYCVRVSGYLVKIGNNRDRFMEDQMCQDACCMCIAQIGELSVHLTDGYKAAHPELPWREIKDTRNYYVHNYGGVDLNYVWNTIQKDLPLLKKSCQENLDK